jgi:hypothetical protein
MTGGEARDQGMLRRRGRGICGGGSGASRAAR